LPNSLEIIGESAFSNCGTWNANLTTFIPEGVTSIGDKAFENCRSFSGELKLPDGIISIGSSAFSECYNISGTLVLPDGLITLGGQLFSRDYDPSATSSISSVIFPNSLTSIGPGALYNTSINGGIEIPISITSVPSSAFAYCSELDSVILHRNVTSVGGGAFTNCSQLLLVKSFSNTPPTITSSTFEGIDYENCVLHVPTGSKTTYQQASHWSLFLNYVEVDFEDNNHIISVTVGSGGILKDGDISISSGSVIDVDSTKVFTVVPNAGYEIESVIYVGEDVTNQLVGNQFTTPEITENTTLSVTFKMATFSLVYSDSDLGSLSLYYQYGDMPTFGISSNGEWSISSIMYNDVDVTTDLVDGKYTVPSITSNSTLRVTYEQIVTSTRSALVSNVRVFTLGSDIVIEGTKLNENVSVYNIEGKQIASIVSDGERQTISVEEHSIYIVRTLTKNFKVAL